MFIKINNSEINEITLRKTKKKKKEKKKRKKERKKGNETCTISEYEKTDDVLWELICLVSEGPLKWQ